MLHQCLHNTSCCHNIGLTDKCLEYLAKTKNPKIASKEKREGGRGRMWIDGRERIFCLLIIMVVFLFFFSSKIILVQYWRCCLVTVYQLNN